MAGRVEKTRFPEVLRQARQEKGLTQTDLADRLGIEQDLVSKYERGVIVHPGGKRVQELAEALGVPVTRFALALVNARNEFEQVHYPELDERPLSEPLRDFLSLDPSDAEAAFLREYLLRLRDWDAGRYDIREDEGAAEDRRNG